MSNKCGREISAFCQVRSLNESPKTIIENEGDTFMLGLNAAKMFKNENEKVKYELQIRNMKEEAKDDDNESGISDNEEK